MQFPFLASIRCAARSLLGWAASLRRAARLLLVVSLLLLLQIVFGVGVASRAFEKAGKLLRASAGEERRGEVIELCFWHRRFVPATQST